MIETDRTTSTVRTPPGAPAVPDGRTALSRSLWFEVMRLRAGVGSMVLAGVVLALGVAHGFNVIWDPAVRQPNGGVSTVFLIDTVQLFAVSVQLPLAGAFLFVLGSGSLAAERRYGVARTTLLTLPSRGMAYLAKLLVSAVVVAGVGAAAALLAVLTVAALNGGRLLAVPADLLTWTFWQPCVNYLVVLACWPVVAVGVSSLTGSRVLTALFMILWPLFLERLAGALLELVGPLRGVRDWMPFAASRAAMTPTTVTDSLAGSDLAPGVGLSVFVVFTLLVAGAGAVRYARREVP